MLQIKILYIPDEEKLIRLIQKKPRAGVVPVPWERAL